MAFKQKLRILVTRIKPESLSGKIYKVLESVENVSVDCLDSNFDITNAHSYPIELGDYDIVYNCSGITLNESILQHKHDQAEKVFNVNAIGAMTLTSEYAKERIKKNLGGLIFHIGSTGSRKVFTNCSAYCASKAALAHYIMCAGYELKKQGIIVIGVHPGNMTGTQMTNMVQDDLRNNRGMTQEQIDSIYAEASDVEDIAGMMVNLINFPLYDMSGENIYIESGRKG